MRISILLLAVVLPAAAIAQNVGIGTTSPGYKLDVLGNGGYRGPVLSKNGSRVAGGTLFISNNDASGQTLRMDGSNIQASYSDPLVFPPQNFTGSMVLNPYGGNVGVGTNFSPEYKLHIWSATEQLIKIDGNNSLVLFHDNVSNAQYGFFRAWTSSPFNPAGYYGLEMGTPPSTGSDPAKRLMFSTNYNLRLTIMEDGKVGVNTTAPNSRFEINGSLSMPIRKLVQAGSYAITDDDYTVIADMENSAGKAMSLVLPSAVGRKGRIYNLVAINLPSVLVQAPDPPVGIVKIYESINQVAKLYSYFEGSFSPVTYGDHKQSRCTFQSDGTQWYIIATDFYEWKDTQ